MTFAEFVEDVLENAFPEGSAENLDTVYRNRIVSALIELQRWVPFIKQRQTTAYPYNGTYYRQGMTVIEKPAGKVRRLGVFNSKTMKDMVYYDVCTREDVDRISQQRARMVEYPDSMPDAYGYFTPTSVLDKGWRSERGLFCIDDSEVTIVPSIESYERVIVEWKGSKTSYEDTDEIDYGKYQHQVQDAVQKYLRMQSIGLEDRSTTDYMMLMSMWKDAVASLILDTKEDTEPEDVQCDLGILPREIMPDAVYPFSLGDENLDLTDGLFYNMWMLNGDGNYYNFGSYVIDGLAVMYAGDTAEAGGRPELTYEVLKLDKLTTNAANTDDYYEILAKIIDGGPVISCAEEVSDISGKQPCADFAVEFIDLLSADDSQYYRISFTDNNGPVITIELAPEDSETSPTPAPNPITAVSSLKMVDKITGEIVYIKIKDGQISLSNQP